MVEGVSMRKQKKSWRKKGALRKYVRKARKLEEGTTVNSASVLMLSHK